MPTGLVAPWHVESSRTRDWTLVLCIGRWILNHWSTREALCLSPFWPLALVPRTVSGIWFSVPHILFWKNRWLLLPKSIFFFFYFKTPQTVRIEEQMALFKVNTLPLASNPIYLSPFCFSPNLNTCWVKFSFTYSAISRCANYKSRCLVHPSFAVSSVSWQNTLSTCLYLQINVSVEWRCICTKWIGNVCLNSKNYGYIFLAISQVSIWKINVLFHIYVYILTIS